MFRSVEEALAHLETCRQGAIAAFEGRGGIWEWRPDDKGPAWYEWCDDCFTYHKGWYVFGYGVSPGQVTCLLWSVDQDGQWEVADEVSVDSFSYSNICLEYGERAWRRSYTRYLRHVARTMTDPAEEFLLPPPVNVSERWRIHVFERGGHVWLMRCELLSGHKVVGTFHPRDEDFPDYLWAYLRMEQLGQVGSYAVDPDHAKSVRDLDEVWVKKENSGQYYSDVLVERTMPVISDEDWGFELRRRAHAALDQL